MDPSVWYLPIGDRIYNSSFFLKSVFPFEIDNEKQHISLVLLCEMQARQGLGGSIEFCGDQLSDSVS